MKSKGTNESPHALTQVKTRIVPAHHIRQDVVGRVLIQKGTVMGDKEAKAEIGRVQQLYQNELAEKRKLRMAIEDIRMELSKIKSADPFVSDHITQCLAIASYAVDP